MEALIDYYNDNLKDKYDDYKIIYMDCFKLYNINKYKSYLKKLKYYIGNYDLVIADYPTRFLNRGKKSVFMDHGSGLKVMPGKDEMNDKKVLKMASYIRQSDYFIMQGDREIDILYRSPILDKKYNTDNYISLGQPRNDKLFNNKYIKESKEEIYKKYKLSNKKLILLAPTWRGYKFDDKGMFEISELEKLNEFLKNNNYKLMYRPHYIEDIIGKTKIENMENIICADVRAEPDAQKILASAEMLITDYSGIMTEFLALNKPIVFLNLDVEKYSSFRGLAIDYYNDIHTPGIKVSNMDQLINYIEDYEKCKDYYEDYRKKAQKYYYKYFDGNSCKRIWDLINSMLSN